MFTKQDCSVFETHKTFENTSLITEVNEPNLLLQKIVKISNVIFKNSRKGPGNTILINEKNLKLFNNINLYNLLVVVENEVPDNLIFVYNKKEYDNIVFIPIVIKEPKPVDYQNYQPLFGQEEVDFGEIQMKHISVCTEEQKNNYKKNLVGCIELI